ncbi:hypothetical protein BMS3Bbin04_01980 [bacterium BMS3Bbin04]|nr:hypothetical protein BMS3Bbin04_01980 [bacterium BMS3Bbin04]
MSYPGVYAGVCPDLHASGYPVASAGVASCPRHLCRGLSDDEYAPVTAAGDSRGDPQVTRCLFDLSGLRTVVKLSLRTAKKTAGHRGIYHS